MVHHIQCRTFVGDKFIYGLDEDLLYHTFPEMGSGTLLLSLELVVALPYDTAVLVCGVPDLGADVEDHRIQPKGTADKILDFFLRRKRVLAKYTKEEKQKAIAIFPDINQQAEQMFHRLIEEMV